MALIECPDCHQKISDAAPACPKCGRPREAVEDLSQGGNEGVTRKEVGFALALGIFLFPLLFSWFTVRSGYSSLARGVAMSWLAVTLLFGFGLQGVNMSKTDEVGAAKHPVEIPESSEVSPEKTAEQLRLEAEACKKDLECWGGKNSSEALLRCPKHIEKLAKYDFKWTDGVFDVKFSHYRWKDKANGVITFIGDKIKLQNGFGAWQNYVYECDFDPLSKSVIDVRTEPGRI